MNRFEKLTVTISIFAITISIGTAIYSSIISKETSSSDYAATQNIKFDTARLLSSLRSIMHKGALFSVSKDPSSVDIDPERKVIQSFLNSPTGFDYYAWVDKKSRNAENQGKKGEPWRIFFLYLAELSNSKNPYSAARRAAEVELLFDDITENDLQEINHLCGNEQI